MKFHTSLGISPTLDRYFNIGANWVYKTGKGWTTKILNPNGDRESPLLVQTDFLIRTDLFHTGFLERVSEIARSSPEVDLMDEQIVNTLENKLEQLEEGQTKI